MVLQRIAARAARDGDDFKKRRTGAPGTVRHPSASYGRVTPDGGQLMKPILKSVPVSVAMAALASLAAAGCGTVTGATPNPALTAQAAFAGYKWTVTAIDQAGKETAVAQRYGVGL